MSRTLNMLYNKRFKERCSYWIGSAALTENRMRRTFGSKILHTRINTIEHYCQELPDKIINYSIAKYRWYEPHSQKTP